MCIDEQMYSATITLTDVHEIKKMDEEGDHSPYLCLQSGFQNGAVKDSGYCTPKQTQKECIVFTRALSVDLRISGFQQ